MGGGGSSVSEAGLPDWARPAVESSLNNAVATEAAGGFSHVQDLTPEQIAAMEQKKQLGAQGGVYDQIAADSYGATQAYRDAAAGTGMFGANALGDQANAMKDSIGQATDALGGRMQGDFSRNGALGSARAQASMDQALTKTGADMARQELESRRGYALGGAGGVLGAGSTMQNQFGVGADTMQGVGDALQQQAQNEGDATYQGIQRLFGLMSSPAVGQKQVTQQSGK